MKSSACRVWKLKYVHGHLKNFWQGSRIIEIEDGTRDRFHVNTTSPAFFSKTNILFEASKPQLFQGWANRDKYGLQIANNTLCMYIVCIGKFKDWWNKPLCRAIRQALPYSYNYNVIYKLCIFILITVSLCVYILFLYHLFVNTQLFSID